MEGSKEGSAEMDFDDKRLPSQGEKKKKKRKKEPPAELKKGKPDDYDGDSKKEASRRKRDEETEDEADCAPLTAEISNVLNKKEKAEEETRDKKKKKNNNNKAPGLEGDGKVGRKKNKKGFDLPGQRRATPNERDPLRIFYETLYKQVPECELAQIRMMESGLLSREEAQKVHKKKQNKTSISPTETVAVESSSPAVERKPSSLGSSRKKEKTETAVTRKKSKKHKDVR